MKVWMTQKRLQPKKITQFFTFFEAPTDPTDRV